MSQKVAESCSDRQLPVNKLIRIHGKEFGFYSNNNGHWSVLCRGVICLYIYIFLNHPVDRINIVSQTLNQIINWRKKSPMGPKEKNEALDIMYTPPLMT